MPVPLFRDILETSQNEGRTLEAESAFLYPVGFQSVEDHERHNQCLWCVSVTVSVCNSTCVYSGVCVCVQECMIEKDRVLVFTFSFASQGLHNTKESPTSLRKTSHYFRGEELILVVCDRQSFQKFKIKFLGKD